MVRRFFLSSVVVAIGAAISGGLAWLGGLFVESSSRWPVHRAKRWVALCKLSDLGTDEPRPASFTFERLEGWYREKVTRQVYVTRDGRGQPVVYSRRCTHLGCPVTWKPQSKSFRCACHGGVFDPQGLVTGGPPPRSLDVLTSRLAGDLIEVEEA